MRSGETPKRVSTELCNDRRLVAKPPRIILKRVMTTLSDKGQVTISMALRERYKLKSGDDFRIIVEVPGSDTPDFVLRRRASRSDCTTVPP